MINENDIDYWKKQRLLAWEDYFYWDKRMENSRSKYETNNFKKQKYAAAIQARKWDNHLQKAYALLN